MNIFIPDPDPCLSAVQLADKHIVKMVTETAQILCTALAERGAAIEGLYRPTHRKHPCVVWAGATRADFDWAVAHGLALATEYTHRYGRTHGSMSMIERARTYRHLIPEGPLRPFALAMDTDLQDNLDPHGSYRRYLCRKYTAWGNGAKWTRRDPPAWYR